MNCAVKVVIRWTNHTRFRTHIKIGKLGRTLNTRYSVIVGCTQIATICTHWQTLARNVVRSGGVGAANNYWHKGMDIHVKGKARRCNHTFLCEGAELVRTVYAMNSIEIRSADSTNCIVRI